MTTSDGMHLDPATLLDYHEKRLPPKDAEDVRAHVEACGVCRAELAMARSFTEAEAAEAPATVKEQHRAAFLQRLGGDAPRAAIGPKESPPPVAPGVAAPGPARRAAPAKVVDVRAHPAWRSWLPHGLLAAAVACVVIAGWQFLHRAPAPGPAGAMRTAPAEDRWGMIVWDPTDSAWPLEWPPVAGAASYVVRVQTAAGEVVAEVPASATGVELKFDVVPAERQGQALYAVAVAVGTEGPLLSTRPRFLPRH